MGTTNKDMMYEVQQEPLVSACRIGSASVLIFTRTRIGLASGGHSVSQTTHKRIFLADSLGVLRGTRFNNLVSKPRIGHDAHSDTLSNGREFEGAMIWIFRLT